MAFKRTYYTRAHPNSNPAIIFGNPDETLRKNNKVESQERISQLIKENSLPKELSNLEDLQFDLSFENPLFRTKSETLVCDTVIDPTFIHFIESKKNIIRLDLDQHVLDTFDKLDVLTSNLIRHIDEAYLQQPVELAALIAATPKPSTIPSESVNSSLFSTTSSIISTTLHSIESFIPKLPL